MDEVISSERTGHIRLANTSDLPRILHIYEKARAFMSANGNPDQWTGGYPDSHLIAEDLVNKNCYVLIEKATVVAVFSFGIGEEPTYKEIRGGAWHHDGPYGTIHRLASDGTVRGTAQICFSFCASLYPYLRIDTHRDNIFMQRAIEKFGFRYCGSIEVRGSERMAYDYSAQ
ncbi:N-acetyltransferase [Colibacter massiliensis]|uniref:N-acetyltransferase n=1 Tax=Colibacter massiliensis TaxID=1852379 RepID=UPI00266C810D|nr:N-acetyltransferase [Colibacter massiliensis]